MSTSVSKPASEAATPVPIFSYAQAAKGRSPSLSTTAQSIKSGSGTAEPKPRSASAQQSDTAGESEIPEKIRRASEGQLAKENVDEAKAKADPEHALDTKPTLDTSILNSQPVLETHSQVLQSTPPSPGFGSTSTSTLIKEEDVSATPNGSSESTWDKVSQTSQNLEKGSGKVDGDDEDSKLSSWEHVPTSTPLKEAPPPAFNIWTKRAKDQQAKASKEVKPSQSPNAQIAKDVIQQGPKKALENASDIGKLDAKKRTRSGQYADDKSTSPIARDTSKMSEGKHRNPEDERRSYSSNRAGETGKPVLASSTPAPPPPGDAISWPTPDIAQEEEKKRSQDRSDKGEKEKTPAKPHGKEKWVPVPYVPTAVFNTPLPPGRRGGGRGARGSREGGGRGGHVVHGSIGGASVGEKPSTTGTNSSATPASAGGDRQRGDMGPPRPGPLPPRAKRAVSAGPPTSREQQRKATDPSLHERNSDAQSGDNKHSQETRHAPAESRRTSIATQTEFFPNSDQASPSGARNDSQGTRRSSQNNADRENGPQSASQDHAHPRSAPDRRSEGSMRPPESFRDYNGFSHVRDRAEGRPERGRGGFRGRGGYNTFASGHSVNGQGPSGGQASAGFIPPKSHSLTERHVSQPQAASFAPPPRERGHRANSRSQSIPNPTGYGRYTSGGPPPGTQHLPALQTDLANMYGYQPGHPAIMSAIPYQPYVEQMQLIGMVQMQMEYYFSVDNLCKDMFLRKHMDSEGFVFLSVLMKFNRIRQLTSDIDLIRYVCRISPTIDIQTGIDGVDRVRKAEAWQQWVLNIDEREATARNDAPVLMQQAQLPPSAAWDPYRSPTNPPALSPRSTLATGRNRIGSFAAQPTTSTASMSAPNMPDNFSNGYASNGPISQTPLSAAVPDFTPSLQSLNLTNLPTLDSQLTSPQNSFSDEQVESLMIVIRKPTSSTTPVRLPLSTTASRTFSNGSLDSSVLSSEVSAPKNKRSGSSVNGERTPESGGKERSRSPFSVGSASKQPTSAASPVFWVKNQEAPIDDLPSDLTHESYTVFRQNALKQREQSLKGQCHRDMDILYQFWSHFLIRNFNARMYDEFRQLAFEDSMTRDTTVGLRNLVTYYDESILGQKVVSDKLARDYVDLAKAEGSGNEKMAFDKLRAAWRNGALNLKNRVKIDKILDADLKADLER